MSGGLKQAFQDELVDGVRLATRVRLITLAAIAILVIARAGPAWWFYISLLLGLAATGLAQGWISRRIGLGYRIGQAILILADMALLAFALTTTPRMPARTGRCRCNFGSAISIFSMYSWPLPS